MKINRLDAHDRFTHLTNQSMDIGKTCQQMINSRPFGDHPFYIFAHKRQLGMDERMAIFMEGKHQDLADVPTDRLIWQPRLTKPNAQENSMLFKGYPGTDVIKVIWMIPDKAMWKQYKKGNLTQNKTVVESIYDFQNNPKKLEAKEDDDLSDEAIDVIYAEICRSAKKPKFEMI